MSQVDVRSHQAYKNCTITCFVLLIRSVLRQTAPVAGMAASEQRCIILQFLHAPHDPVLTYDITIIVQLLKPKLHGTINSVMN